VFIRPQRSGVFPVVTPPPSNRFWGFEGGVSAGFLKSDFEEGGIDRKFSFKKLLFF